ncbi:hypothetical protein [Variovorax sp.]|jgi:hypothetical protein|uniref:hypothetical protein n=1 Tax=Variovorax sp. TaxID=1871043 RepID=UPI0037DA0A3F
MKLTFSWHQFSDGTSYARCLSDKENPQGASPLAHVLDDDGGLGAEIAVKWIEEGKRLARQAMAGAPGPLHWVREHFMAEMNGERTTASSVHDPSCAQELPTRVFLSVLQSWQDFLATGPVPKSHTVEIDDR